MKHEQGFSLIELMITVVIVSILASIAIPNYRNYVTRSRIPEATAGLGDIRVRMEQFYQDNRTYPTGGCVVAPVAPTALQLQVPSGNGFDFDCGTGASAPNATTYRVTATGKGSMAGFKFTLDQFNSRSSIFSGTAAADGWVSHSPDNCWVSKKGGKC